MGRPAQILVAMFQGGGNIALLIPIMSRLIARGHKVRIIAGPGVRRSRLPVSPGFIDRISSTGAALVRFQEPHPAMVFEPRARGIIGGWVPRGFDSVPGEAQTAAWASVWAKNVLEELR